jgi:hypothetical protein
MHGDTGLSALQRAGFLLPSSNPLESPKACESTGMTPNNQKRIISRSMEINPFSRGASLSPGKGELEPELCPTNPSFSGQLDDHGP